MSKRHGALGVDAYRDEMGILPEALSNYLLRLGWGHGDDEIITLAKRSNGSTSTMSQVAVTVRPQEALKPQRPLHAQADDARLAALVAPRLGLDAAGEALLTRAMPELKARAHDLNQLAEGAAFRFAARPLAIATRPRRCHQRIPRPSWRDPPALAAVPAWDHDSTDAAVREVAERLELKLGKLAQPLRAALTGKTTSPGIFDVLALLGKDESLARIADQMLEPNA